MTALKNGRETGETPLIPPVTPALCTSTFEQGEGSKGGTFSNSSNIPVPFIKGLQMLRRRLAFHSINANFQSVGFGLSVRKQRTLSPTGRTEPLKTNIARFPDRYRFQLTMDEMRELVANCDRFNVLKHSTSAPYAFTVFGVSMLPSVLTSQKAIDTSIKIG